MGEQLRAKGMKYQPKIVLAFFKEMRLPEPVTEFRFESTRKWRFDFAFVDYKLALEVEGGLFVLGAHNQGARIKKTIEKENEAQVQGGTYSSATPKTSAHVLPCI